MSGMEHLKLSHSFISLKIHMKHHQTLKSVINNAY